MSFVGNKAKKRTYTTGQMSGISGLHRQTLYRYVRDFGEYFTETARQHKQGRRWEFSDVEVARAIRGLYHEGASKEKIKGMLKGGYRLADNEAWTRELQSKLIEIAFAANANADDISRQAIAAINDLENKTFFVEWNLKAFQELWITVHDLIDEVEAIEHLESITGKVKRSVGKKYHGKPPILYELVPLAGNLKDYKVVEGGYDDSLK